MKRLLFVALAACSGTLCLAAEPPRRCRAAPRRRRASRRPPSSRSSRRPTRTSTRCTASCSCATATSSPRAGGRRTTPRRRTSLYSLSKSFTSTAVGLAVAEGKLSLDDEVLKFFPDEAPAEPSNNLKAMRVRDLLRMSTGHQTEPPRTAGRALGEDVPRPARSRSSRARTSSTTRRRPTCSRPSSRRRPGRPCSTTCRPRLFEPLGIEKPDLGGQPAGHHGRRLRAERPHRGHRQVRPALPAEGEVAGQAARARGVGRGGDRPADVQRQQPEERLGPGLRLPVLALPPRRLPRRRGVRPVLHRAARAGRGGRHHQRRARTCRRC